MSDLRDKLEALLKGLFALKEQQDFFVPSIKPSGMKAPAAPKPLDSGLKTNSATPNIAGGLPPPSKKDPVKVAEQLKNPHPVKPPVEFLKFNDNGQWSLVKKDDTLTIPMSSEAANIQQQKVSSASVPVSAQQHGFKTHLPHQHELIEGLTLHNVKPIGAGNQGAAFATSQAHPHTAIVKNSAHHDDRFLRGHLRNNFNSARREVLYHDMAHHFFGLGDHVPTTAGFTIGGDDWSAQKMVSGASHPIYVEKDGQVRLENENHERVLRDLHNKGHLDKLAIMDFIMGHHDRHGNNFMIDEEGDGIHLIDNGTAFDYGNNDGHPIPGYMKRVQDLQLHNEGGHHHSKGFHPKAKKWVMNLSPEKAIKIFIQHGHDDDSPAIEGFLSRLLHLQEELSDPNSKKSANRLIREGQMLTHQEPEEYL